jgi:hypothetical protein
VVLDVHGTDEQRDDRDADPDGAEVLDEPDHGEHPSDERAVDQAGDHQEGPTDQRDTSAGGSGVQDHPEQHDQHPQRARVEPVDEGDQRRRGQSGVRRRVHAAEERDIDLAVAPASTSGRSAGARSGSRPQRPGRRPPGPVRDRRGDRRRDAVTDPGVEADPDLLPQDRRGDPGGLVAPLGELADPPGPAAWSPDTSWRTTSRSSPKRLSRSSRKTSI